MAISWLLAIVVAAAPTDQQVRELFAAARTGDLQTVRHLVEGGVPASAEHTWGMTALTVAAEHGRLDVVRFLLERGADPNAHYTFHDYRPIEVARWRGHVDVAILLLQNGAENREAALEAALRTGSVPLAEAAIESGPLLASRLEVLRQQAIEKDAALQAVMTRAESRPDPPPPTLSVEQLRQLEGRFEGWDSGEEVAASVEGDRLVLTLGEERFPLEVVADNSFRSTDASVDVVFWGRAGTIEGIRLTRAGGEPQSLRETVADIVDAGPADLVGAELPAVKRAPTVNWPSFRGANSDGIGDGADTPTSWDVETGENILWQAELPGLGNSSPIVWGDRVFVTTALAEGVEQKIETGLTGSGREVDEAVEHSWRVLAYDKRTGEQLWSTEVGRAVPQTRRHFKASQASSSPATDGESVAVVFPTAGLALLDMDGEIRWQYPLGGLATGAFTDPTIQWGFASSPIIHRSRVIVQVDIQDGPYIAAWSVDEGDLLWRTEHEVAPSWATPVLFRYGDTEELVANGSKIAGYDPETGAELWRLGPSSELVIATPVVGDGVVYASAGYPPIKPIYAIKAGARGHLDVEPGKQSERLAWSHKRGGAYMPTPLLYRGLFYVVHHNSRLVVYDAKSGKPLAKKRFSRAGAFTASPVAVNGKLYAPTEEGLVYVLEAGRDPKELAVMDMGEPVMASPAVSEGILLIRTPTRLVAIGSKGAAGDE